MTPCAVVTGGARNIGQAIGLRLQQDGFRVIALDIEEPEAESLRADARKVDLSDRAAAEAVFADIAATLPVTVLVNTWVSSVPPCSTRSTSTISTACSTSTCAHP